MSFSLRFNTHTHIQSFYRPREKIYQDSRFCHFYILVMVTYILIEIGFLNFMYLCVWLFVIVASVSFYRQLIHCYHSYHCFRDWMWPSWEEPHQSWWSSNILSSLLFSPPRYSAAQFQQRQKRNTGLFIFECSSFAYLNSRLLKKYGCMSWKLN